MKNIVEKRQGETPLKNAPEKCQEKTPLKIGVERREVKDERIHGHLEATLQMLKERHGEGFSFTLMARHENPDPNSHGQIYIVTNDPDIAFMHGVLGRVIQQGLAGSEQEGS